MGEFAGNVVALAGGVGGAKLADGLAQLLGERLDGDREHRRRFQPSRPAHFARSRHRDVHARRHRQSADRMGHRRRDLEFPRPGASGSAGRRGSASAIAISRPMSCARSASPPATPDSAVTAALCRALGVTATLLPMSDDPVRTIIRTDDGELPFQDYFVRLACAVPVRGIRYDGAPAARLNPALARSGTPPPSSSARRTLI